MKRESDLMEDDLSLNSENMNSFYPEFKKNQNNQKKLNSTQMRRINSEVSRIEKKDDKESFVKKESFQQMFSNDSQVPLKKRKENIFKRENSLNSDNFYDYSKDSRNQSFQNYIIEEANSDQNEESISEENKRIFEDTLATHYNTKNRKNYKQNQIQNKKNEWNSPTEKNYSEVTDFIDPNGIRLFEERFNDVKKNWNGDSIEMKSKLRKFTKDSKLSNIESETIPQSHYLLEKNNNINEKKNQIFENISESEEINFNSKQCLYDKIKQTKKLIKNNQFISAKNNEINCLKVRFQSDKKKEKESFRQNKENIFFKNSEQFDQMSTFCEERHNNSYNKQGFLLNKKEKNVITKRSLHKYQGSKKQFSDYLINIKENEDHSNDSSKNFKPEELSNFSKNSKSQNEETKSENFMDKYIKIKISDLHFIFGKVSNLCDLISQADFLKNESKNVLGINRTNKIEIDLSIEDLEFMIDTSQSRLISHFEKYIELKNEMQLVQSKINQLSSKLEKSLQDQKKNIFSN